MTETITGEVIHVIGPEELDEAELVGELRSLADARYVLVCREGGTPGWLERIWSFLTRDPIQPVTIVADEGPAEGTEITATVHETDLPGVYEAVDLR